MRQRYFAAIAGASAVLFAVPAAAYPPPDSVDVSVASRVVAARGAVEITVNNIKPNVSCTLLFNKKRTDCGVDGSPYRFETTLTAPTTRGKFRIVVSVPSDGEYGRSDSTFVYVPYVRIPGLAKRDREWLGNVSYLPQDTEVALTVNGSPVAADFAGSDGAVTGLSWTPSAKGTYVVRLFADGSQFFSRTYKVR